MVEEVGGLVKFHEKPSSSSKFCFLQRAAIRLTQLSGAFPPYTLKVSAKSMGSIPAQKVVCWTAPAGVREGRAHKLLWCVISQKGNNGERRWGERKGIWKKGGEGVCVNSYSLAFSSGPDSSRSAVHCSPLLTLLPPHILDLWPLRLLTMSLPIKADVVITQICPAPAGQHDRVLRGSRLTSWGVACGLLFPYPATWGQSQKNKQGEDTSCQPPS